MEKQMRKGFLLVLLGLSFLTPALSSASDLQNIQQKCSAGDGNSCLDLGVMYYSGDGVPGDLRKAGELFEKSCNLGIGLGCYNRGINYFFGNGVPIDIKKANYFFEKGCSLSYGDACRNLALSYEEGTGVEQSLSQARKYNEKEGLLRE